MQKLLVIGGGEHAAVVIDAVGEDWQVLGYTDDSEKSLEIPYLGKDEEIPSILSTDTDVRLMFGVGDISVRRKVVDCFGLVEDQFTKIIHPSANVSKGASIGHGVFVGAGAVIQINAVVSSHAIINSGAIVEHDCRIDAYSHIAPGAKLGGGCHVMQSTFVGLGACVRDHIEIGESVTVGMGSVVLHSIDDGETVIGNPARRIEGKL